MLEALGALEGKEIMVVASSLLEDMLEALAMLEDMLEA